MSRSNLFLGIIILNSFLYSCTTKKELSSESTESIENKLLQPPITILKTKAEFINFRDVENGGLVRLSAMTEMEVPVNAFVYADGTPVKGQVQFKYREFKDAIDVILNGIPMEYDSAGMQNIFQTAGMFDINGYQNNSPIFIKEGSSLKIKMTTSISDGSYNGYELDTVTGKWTYLVPMPVLAGPANTDGNKLDDEFPIGPAAYDPNGHIVDLKIDVKNYPELASLKGLMWQYAGDDVNADLVNNKDLYKVNWRNMELLPKDREKSVFQLVLKSNTKFDTLLVKPVLVGKAFDKAYEQFIANKEEYIRKKKEEMGILPDSKSIVSRVLAINRFGFYNCDRIYYSNEAVAADLSINTDNDEYNNNSEGKVYLISGDARVAYKFAKSNLNKFRFLQDADNALVVILPNEKVAVFSNNEFKKLDLKEIRKTGKLNVDLETMPENIVSADQIRRLIGA
ncbi:MAG: hypothetical protein J7604_09075 [Sporocytophaga sp.]|uniref:hypothetical protein n=1 Tax=Sporocytophaga sp. TaxID=2231183 RepID=UPI001B25943A|nr:hypothetical protein [Sporocytophaga sp.]MBO9700346.1 hypothetical protein [Sporocytophaga sp.]